MQDIKRIKGIVNGADPVSGKVHWKPAKSVWVTLIFCGAIIGAPLTFSIDSFIVFIVSTAVTLCLGHSVGMHRRLIHNSFSCPLWLEYILVHFGCLVGLGGPISMTYTHDLRDWAQRQSECHDYFSHQQAFLKDAYWQMHCDIKLSKHPVFTVEKRIKNSKVYYWMEKTWMWQQLPWGLLFYFLGGFDWLVWGIFVRLAVSISGHWLVGYFAHSKGAKSWLVDGAAVQGHNIHYLGIITMGECWHNNHHAFPESAKIGINVNESDPGWWLILLLEKLGLAWNIKTAGNLPFRKELKKIG